MKHLSISFHPKQMARTTALDNKSLAKLLMMLLSRSTTFLVLQILSLLLPISMPIPALHLPSQDANSSPAAAGLLLSLLFTSTQDPALQYLARPWSNYCHDSSTVVSRGPEMAHSFPPHMGFQITWPGNGLGLSGEAVAYLLHPTLWCLPRGNGWAIVHVAGHIISPAKTESEIIYLPPPQIASSSQGFNGPVFQWANQPDSLLNCSPTSICALGSSHTVLLCHSPSGCFQGLKSCSLGLVPLKCQPSLPPLSCLTYCVLPGCLCRPYLDEGVGHTLYKWSIESNRSPAWHPHPFQLPPPPSLVWKSSLWWLFFFLHRTTVVSIC